MSALIFRIESQQVRTGMLSLSFSDADLIESVVRERMDEKVALGASDVPGIWTILAIGKISGLWRRGDHVHLHISDITTLAVPVEAVTAGDRRADFESRPYAIDVLDQEDMARVFGRVEVYQQETVPRVLAAAESVWTNASDGVLHGGLHLKPQGARFFYGVAVAYRWRCAFTGMSQASLDGGAREGVVLGLDDPFELRDGPPSGGLFVSGTIAFCYRHGLLAIGDEYDILRHPELGAQLRILLEMVNPKALLFLPNDQENWPDLSAARRHRLRFGY